MPSGLEFRCKDPLIKAAVDDLSCVRHAAFAVLLSSICFRLAAFVELLSLT
jgi:hypothetical protein